MALQFGGIFFFFFWWGGSGIPDELILWSGIIHFSGRLNASGLRSKRLPPRTEHALLRPGPGRELRRARAADTRTTGTARGTRVTAAGRLDAATEEVLPVVRLDREGVAKD